MNVRLQNDCLRIGGNGLARVRRRGARPNGDIAGEEPGPGIVRRKLRGLPSSRCHRQAGCRAVAHGDPRLGKLWYDNICSTCHGLAGDGYEAGGTGTAIGLPGFLNKVSDGFIRETVKKGRSNTRMLAFQGPEGLADLSDREIDDIIVYLRALAKK